MSETAVQRKAPIGAVIKCLFEPGRVVVAYFHRPAAMALVDYFAGASRAIQYTAPHQQLADALEIGSFGAAFVLRRLVGELAESAARWGRPALLRVELSTGQYRRIWAASAFREPYLLDRGASPTEAADVVFGLYNDGTAELVKSTDPALWAACVVR